MSTDIGSEIADYTLEEQLERMNFNLLKKMEKPGHGKCSSDLTDILSQKAESDLDWNEDYLSMISELNTLEQGSCMESLEDRMEELLQRIDRQSMMLEDFRSRDQRQQVNLSRSELSALIEKLESLHAGAPQTSLEIGNTLFSFALKEDSSSSTHRLRPLHLCDEPPLYLLTPKEQHLKAQEIPSSLKKLEDKLSVYSSSAKEVGLERQKNKANNLKGEKAIYESASSQHGKVALNCKETIGMIKKRQKEIAETNIGCYECLLYEDPFYEQKKTLIDLKQEATLISKRQAFQRIMIEKKKQMLIEKERYIAKRQETLLNHWMKEPSALEFLPMLSNTLRMLNGEYSNLAASKEKFYNEILEFESTKAKIEKELQKYNTTIIRNHKHLGSVAQKAEDI